MELRAHHLLCMRYFKGKGYNKKFVDNFNKVLEEIKKDDQVRITNRVDCICKSCPHNKKGKCNKNGAKSEYDAMKKDDYIIEQLGLKQKKDIRADEVKELIDSNQNKLQLICNDCEWKIYCK